MVGTPNATRSETEFRVDGFRQPSWLLSGVSSIVAGSGDVADGALGTGLLIRTVVDDSLSLLH